jgi:broad specificity phosphatase PhoE
MIEYGLATAKIAKWRDASRGAGCSSLRRAARPNDADRANRGDRKKLNRRDVDSRNSLARFVFAGSACFAGTMRLKAAAGAGICWAPHEEAAMSRVYLIRHAKPSATWGGDDDDPGLDAQGLAQAEAARDALLALPAPLRPTRVVSSPLRRCQETAAPFAKAIGAELEIDPYVGEIPTPKGMAADARGPWLREAFTGRWADIKGDLDYDAWRAQVAAAVASRPDAAVFSHFVAINAVLTSLASLPEVITLRPDHASICVFDLENGTLRLMERAREAGTQVL